MVPHRYCALIGPLEYINKSDFSSAQKINSRDFCSITVSPFCAAQRLAAMSGKGAKGLSGKGAKGTMGDKKGDKKKPVSRSARAGLQFPVGRIHRLLKVSGWRRRSRKPL